MYNPKTNCYLCGSSSYQVIHRGVRGDERINVLKCNSCGLVRLDKFVINEITDFYEKSKMWETNGMNSSVDKARIDAYADDNRRAEYSYNYIYNKNVLDFGCGSGGYMHLIKNMVNSVEGVEAEKEKREKLLQEGLICYPSVFDLQKKEYDVITMYHVLEHLPDPIEMLKLLGGYLTEDGRIIIEVPNSEDALLSLFNCDEFADFTYWVCHLYLFSNNTLSDLVVKAGYSVELIVQVQRYPLSNHLYWLSKGKPGGHREWALFNNKDMDEKYGENLARHGMADTILAVIKK